MEWTGVRHEEMGALAAGAQADLMGDWQLSFDDSGKACSRCEHQSYLDPARLVTPSLSFASACANLFQPNPIL